MLICRWAGIFPTCIGELNSREHGMHGMRGILPGPASANVKGLGMLRKRTFEPYSDKWTVIWALLSFAGSTTP